MDFDFLFGLLFLTGFLLSAVYEKLKHKYQLSREIANTVLPLSALRDFSDQVDSLYKRTNCPYKEKFSCSDELYEYMNGWFDVGAPILSKNKNSTRYRWKQFQQADFLGYCTILKQLIDLYSRISINQDIPLDEKYRPIYILCIVKLFGETSSLISLHESFGLSSTREKISSALQDKVIFYQQYTS